VLFASRLHCRHKPLLCEPNFATVQGLFPCFADTAGASPARLGPPEIVAGHLSHTHGCAQSECRSAAGPEDRARHGSRRPTPRAVSPQKSLRLRPRRGLKEVRMSPERSDECQETAGVKGAPRSPAPNPSSCFILPGFVNFSVQLNCRGSDRLQHSLQEYEL
jgi:hypothetical protein